MVFRDSRSSGSVIFENVFISSETLTLPSISLRMLRRSRDRALVLPVASMRPLPVLVRIDRRFILGSGSSPYYRQVGAPQGEGSQSGTRKRLCLSRARPSIPAATGRLD